MKYNEIVERHAPRLGRKNLANGLSCPPFVYMEDSDDGMWVHYVTYCENIRKLKRALWLSRAERYKMREFIAREEANLVNQMSWSQILRERTYDQWVRKLIRIANLANKLQNKCLAKAEEYR